ncbi:MAG TPA: MXAN_6640 family putative metalloprotease [Solirubrobacterales bacterium]
MLALSVLAPASASAGDRWAFRAPAARPTDGPVDNINAYKAPEAPYSPACSLHFCVHWVAKGADAPKLTDANGVSDGDGVPDFVERVQGVAEHVHSIENDTLGWREPKSDGRQGGGSGKTDIYLAQIGGELFGYAAPDRGQATQAHRLPRHLHGYLVVDDDYDRSEFPGGTQLGNLKVTIAHEYNHILQFSYDAYQDSWFVEATAVWMEDQVYDGLNDYWRYVRRWTRSYQVPMTVNAIKEYGSAVWNQWLAHRYGRQLIRDAWDRAVETQPGGFSVSAYGSAIDAVGGSSFGRDFARFSRDLAEWRTTTVFPEARAFRDVSRQGSLPVDGSSLRRRLSHTTSQLLRVHVDGGRAVVVRAIAPPETEVGLALVGRVGTERNGDVVSKLRFKPGGGTMSVRLARPGRFDRITAVLINADTSVHGYNAGLFDWNYLRDAVPFVVSARAVR